MSFFTKGILLEQHKEPMLSRNILIMRQEYKYFDCDFPDVPMEELSPEQIIEIARLAGIVDESDGSLLAEKLEKAAGGRTDTLAIDAIDDEPYISSQMSIAFHQQEKLAAGAEYCMRVLKPDHTYIAIYKHIFDVNLNIPKAIGGIKVEKIGGLYPAEDRAYRHIPKGRNKVIVGACALVHLARAVEDSRMMTSCFITVGGDAIATPRNVEVPIGTKVSTILELCGLAEEPEVIVVGGPMTGRSIFEPDEELVGPTTKGILALSRSYSSYTYKCIGCGRCDHACPQALSPAMIRLLAEAGKEKELLEYDADHCTGCGACSYVCPARLNVAAAVFKAGKTAQQLKKEGAK